MDDNLIPFPYENDTKTTNGITFTVRSDSSILVDGVASKDTFFKLTNDQNCPIKKGIYCLRGCPSLEAPDGCDLRVSNGSGGMTGYLYYGGDYTGDGYFFCLSEDIERCYVYIKVSEGTEVHNRVFRPSLTQCTPIVHSTVPLAAGAILANPIIESQEKNDCPTSSITNIPNRKLSNGVLIPYVGLGVFRIGNDKSIASNLIIQSILAGCRMFDTAASYGNEDMIGYSINVAVEQGICKREDLFVTTKMHVPDMHDYRSAKQAIRRSLDKLNLDYIDLYLLHESLGDYFSAWKAVEEAYKAGLIRAIGVSNFYPSVLTNFCETVTTLPMVNQIETHPHHVQRLALATMNDYDITPIAWSPLGASSYNFQENETLLSISRAHGKTVAQVMLRWNVQRGVVVIPKSSSIEHLSENMDIWDFSLSENEMERIELLDYGYSGPRIVHFDPIFVRSRTGTDHRVRNGI